MASTLNAAFSTLMSISRASNMHLPIRETHYNHPQKFRCSPYHISSDKNSFFIFSTHCDLSHCDIFSLIQFLPNFPDQIFKIIPALPATPARAGCVHDRLRGVRAATNGILHHAVCDVSAMTCFFPAIHNVIPPEKFPFFISKSKACCYLKRMALI